MNQQVITLDADAGATRKKFVLEEAIQQMQELKQERDTAPQEFAHYQTYPWLSRRQYQSFQSILVHTL